MNQASFDGADTNCCFGDNKHLLNELLHCLRLMNCSNQLENGGIYEKDRWM